MKEATSREDLMDFLQAKYPKMWMKPGEEFSSSENKTNSIWTGEGSSSNDDCPLFDHYAMSPLYEMGIYVELATLLKWNGWYCEWYDGGTVFIYPI